MNGTIMSTKPEAQKDVLLKRVLLAPGSADYSDPVNGLAQEFRDQGIDVLLAGDSISVDTAKWLNFARRSQALIFIRYQNGNGRFLQRQLFRAKLLGCAVVRWWVGTDVLNCLASEETMRAARMVDRAVDLNIAVSPHLIGELGDIGIKAEYVPSLCDLKNVENSPAAEELPKGVLAYLPTKRKTFYGEDVLVSAIESNPDLPFFVVGDESHSLGHYPNVTSFGWIESLDHVWPKVGVLLRVTKHDGMPRMVLEALARSRYVIYSEAFDGCWLARTPEQVSEHLRYFKTLKILNRIGPTITHNFSATAGTRYTESLAQLVTPALSLARLKNMAAALNYALPTLVPARQKSTGYTDKSTK
ncbi:glycosyltransferase family 4 protein [Marinobacter fonticola]|uniref:glycosyltransferase family 4 protein n=1 Tax=Marinobacter fonticola TaxID=2603215 RepID=UPI0011E6C3CD|nr:glycosyltransferase family 4 protein [Marinobacter fonticola]